MKLVKAVVRTETMEALAAALETAGAPGFTVTTVRGRGQYRQTALYRGQPFTALTPMEMVDVVVADTKVDDIVRVFLDHAHTGHHGDGHVMVLPLEERYAIRTRWLEVA